MVVIWWSVCLVGAESFPGVFCRPFWEGQQLTEHFIEGKTFFKTANSSGRVAKIGFRLQAGRLPFNSFNVSERCFDEALTQDSHGKQMGLYICYNLYTVPTPKPVQADLFFPVQKRRVRNPEMSDQMKGSSCIAVQEIEHRVFDPMDGVSWIFFATKTHTDNTTT